MTNALKEKLSKGEFVITAELCPPKGPDVSSFIGKAKLLKGLVDAVNITDNQRAMMRMSSIACAKITTDEGLLPILQITCRDRNRIAIQSDLLGASAFGINNVLAITGDYVSEGDNPEAKAVFDIDSAILIKTIAGMNDGIELSGKILKGKTDFFIGAAVNPCAEPVEPHRIAFEKKVSCGAQFFQTQAIFDIDKFSEFMDYAKNFPVKVLGGILLLKSLKMAQFLNENVPGVYVPDVFLKRLERSKDPMQTGIEIAREQVEELKKICHGVHIMTVGNEERVVNILH
jgi:5,10-methylenetetrahydrofolate reductase